MKKLELFRSPEQIRARELLEVKSVISLAAATFYAPNSEVKRSILGDNHGYRSKIFLEHFAKKYHDIRHLNIEWKYWSSEQTSQLKTSAIDLFLDENMFRIVGPWPETSKQISEVWDREKQIMKIGGRADDYRFE